MAANDVEVGAHILHGVGDEVADAVVDEVVVEQRADEELEAEVVDLLRFLGVRDGKLGVALGGDESSEDLELLELGALLEGLAELRLTHSAVLSLEVLLALEYLLVVGHASPFCVVGNKDNEIIPAAAPGKSVGTAYAAAPVILPRLTWC